MEPIETIGIPNVTIPQVVQRDWLIGVPFVPNNDPPVTLQLGFPIVEMPGCVTMHKDNKDHITKMPFDHDLAGLVCNQMFKYKSGVVKCINPCMGSDSGQTWKHRTELNNEEE